MALILGGVVFKKFEIPENIVFPIRQRHHIHYFLGSSRVVDAAGTDPQPIRWAGRFTGPDASSRVRTLISMTESGQEWLLVFASFMSRVLIVEFAPDLEKPWDIRYMIEVLPTGAEGARGGRDYAVSNARQVTLDDIGLALTGATNAASVAAEASP